MNGNPPPTTGEFETSAMNGRFEKWLTGGLGCLVALLIGLAVVGSAAITLYRFAGVRLDLREEWVPLLANVLIVATPFVLFAFSGERRWAIWATAAVLTIAVWGLLVAYVVLGRGPSGANIGLGLLMLVSPLFILAFTAAAHSVMARLRQ